MKNYNFDFYKEEIKPKFNFDYILEIENNKIYQNLFTGKRGPRIADVRRFDRSFKLIRERNKYHYFTYWKATENKKFLCVIVYEINLENIKEGEIKEYRECERYYFTKDRKIIIPNTYNFGDEICEGKYKIIGSKDIVLLKYNLSNTVAGADGLYRLEEDFFKFRDEAQKVFPKIVNLSTVGVCAMNTPFIFNKYLLDNCKIEQNSCEQEIINDFVIKTKDIDIFYLLKNTNITKEEINFSYIQKIEDKFLVIRIFSFIYKDLGLGAFKEKFKKDDFYVLETERIYIKENKVYSCSFNFNGEWIFESLRDHEDKVFFPNDPDDLIKLKYKKYFVPNILLDFNKDIFKNTILEYMEFELDGLKISDKHNILMLYLRYPMLVEAFFKYGLGFIIIDACEAISLDPLVNINSCIKLNMNKNSFNTILGLNWKQIGILSNIHEKEVEFMKESFKENNMNFKNSNGSIAAIKEMLEVNSISYMDDESFSKMISFVVFYTDKIPYDYFLYFRNINQMYGFNAVLRAIDLVEQYYDKYMYEYVLNSNNLMSVNHIYLDYIDMVYKINGSSMFSYNFKDPCELLEKHDIVASIYNAKQNQFEKEAFNKAVKRVKNFTYKDSNYAIIVPDEPEDIVKEGIELNHCVKTYISRVIDGRTNIMFLRKVDDINSSFFTIEISNDGIIEQIHGFCNCNIEEGSDLENFINKWADVKHLKLNNYNKIR